MPVRKPESPRVAPREVVARPIDVFAPNTEGVAPPRRGPTELQRVASSLQQLAPVANQILQKKAMTMAEDEGLRTAEQLAEDYNGDPETWRKRVESGEVSFGDNPWARKVARTQFYRLAANRIYNDVKQQGVEAGFDSMSPQEVEAAARKAFAERAKEDGLDDGSPEFSKNFLAQQEAAIGRILEDHSKIQAERTQEAIVDQFTEEIGEVAELATDEDITDYGLVLGEIATNAHAAGQSWRQVNRMTVNTLTAGAIKHAFDGDFDTADRHMELLNHIPAGTGVLGKVKRSEIRQQIDNTQAQIDRMRETASKTQIESNKALVKSTTDEFRTEAFTISVAKGPTSPEFQDLMARSLQAEAEGMAEPGSTFKLMEFRAEYLATNNKLSDEVLEVNQPLHDAIHTTALTDPARAQEMFMENYANLPNRDSLGLHLQNMKKAKQNGWLGSIKDLNREVARLKGSTEFSLLGEEEQRIELIETQDAAQRILLGKLAKAEKDGSVDVTDPNQVHLLMRETLTEIANTNKALETSVNVPRKLSEVEASNTVRSVFGAAGGDPVASLGQLQKLVEAGKIGPEQAMKAYEAAIGAENVGTAAAALMRREAAESEAPRVELNDVSTRIDSIKASLSSTSADTQAKALNEIQKVISEAQTAGIQLGAEAAFITELVEPRGIIAPIQIDLPVEVVAVIKTLPKDQRQKFLLSSSGVYGGSKMTNSDENRRRLAELLLDRLQTRVNPSKD